MFTILNVYIYNLPAGVVMGGGVTGNVVGTVISLITLPFWMMNIFICMVVGSSLSRPSANSMVPPTVCQPLSYSRPLTSFSILASWMPRNLRLNTMPTGLDLKKSNHVMLLNSCYWTQWGSG